MIADHVTRQGISAFIELARAAAASTLTRTVVFTANSGHECGHLGMDAFLAGPTAVAPPDAHAWIHLGANFGSANMGTNPSECNSRLGLPRL